MTWRTNRASELPSDWKQRREAAARRAGYQCEAVTDGIRCPNQGSECDHLADRLDHSLEALQWLCSDCHRAKTKREAQAAIDRISAKRHPPKRRHPGLRDD